MKTAIVTGGSSGLGQHILKGLLAKYYVHDWSLEEGIDVADINDIRNNMQDLPDKIDLLVNCAGFNHMNWITDLPDIMWETTFDINVKSIFLTAKYLADKLRNGTILNILSSASHVPMMHSSAYNASKAAAVMMTRQMAKELWVSHKIIAFGISPSKMKNTKMTEMTDGRAALLRNMTLQEAHAYQLSKLLLGEEIDPVQVAEFACWLLEEKSRHKYLAGCILEYGA